MKDDEIRVKPLSDWKPETDIKLQKAFGKFVEEVGELLEAIVIYYKYTWSTERSLDDIHSGLEDEIADCEAVIEMIETVVNDRSNVVKDCYVDAVNEFNSESETHVSSLNNLSWQAGKALCVVGRCQIQSLKGLDPKTKELNIVRLGNELIRFRAALHSVISVFGFNKERIRSRRDAKVDTKLPWVLGTATDLLSEDLSPEVLADRQPITFAYKNYKGELSTRSAIPLDTRFGTTEWHPEPGYLFKMYDLEKQAVREFALADCDFTKKE